MQNRVVKINDLQHVNNIGFPQLPKHLFNPLVYDVTGGPGPLIGASSILSYISFTWMKANNPQLDIFELQNSLDLPLEHNIQYFVQENRPEGWNNDLFGDFSSCTVVRMLCPPSHNSDSDTTKWKYAVVCFSSSNDNRLGIRGPLSKIVAWTCIRCPSKMGLMRTCKHVAALLMVLAFPYAFVLKTLVVSLLNPKAAIGTQTAHVMSDSNFGGWSTSSLGSERISKDTRKSNLLYPNVLANDIPLQVQNLQPQIRAVSSSSNFSIPALPAAVFGNLTPSNRVVPSSTSACRLTVDSEALSSCASSLPSTPAPGSTSIPVIEYTASEAVTSTLASVSPSLVTVTQHSHASDIYSNCMVLSPGNVHGSTIAPDRASSLPAGDSNIVSLPLDQLISAVEPVQIHHEQEISSSSILDTRYFSYSNDA